MSPTMGFFSISELLKSFPADFPAAKRPAVDITSSEHMKKYRHAIDMTIRPIA